jgi:hypothetical protein
MIMPEEDAAPGFSDRGESRAARPIAESTPPSPKMGNRDAELDAALELTFPASDPIAVFRPDRANAAKPGAALK